MSQLFGLTFFENGKEHFSTEMRAVEQPMAQARSYVDERERAGVPAAVLVVQLQQHGVQLTLERITEVVGPAGAEHPPTLAALQQERAKTVTRHAKPRAPKKRRGPAVFTTQKDGGIRKSQGGKKSQTLHGAAARDAILIEFGSGKNKRLVPLEDAQRMASQLETVSRQSSRATRRPPPRRKARPATTTDVLDQVRARPAVTPCRPKFQLGIIEVTDGAKAVASSRELHRGLDRFMSCDWGDVSAVVVRRNNISTRKRQGLLRGRYPSKQGVFVIESVLSKTGNGQTFIALPEEID